MRSVEFACIFRGNVATGNLPVKPPQRGDLNQLASLILGAIQPQLVDPRGLIFKLIGSFDHHKCRTRDQAM